MIRHWREKIQKLARLDFSWRQQVCSVKSHWRTSAIRQAKARHSRCHSAVVEAAHYTVSPLSASNGLEMPPAATLSTSLSGISPSTTTSSAPDDARHCEPTYSPRKQVLIHRVHRLLHRALFNLLRQPTNYRPARDQCVWANGQRRHTSRQHRLRLTAREKMKSDSVIPNSDKG